MGLADRPMVVPTVAKQVEDIGGHSKEAPMTVTEIGDPSE